MRYLLGLLLLFLAPSTASHAAQQVDLADRAVLEAAPALKTGEFIWAPEKSPTGPTLLIINLDTQRAVLFRDGIPIAASTLSTGRPGLETPTGVFTILQKRVEHYSTTYDNAPMPYMQRLTWKGIALHAGHLPGYPASHGCIRLPKQFARLLYGVTNLGMTVVVTRLPVLPGNADGTPLAARPAAGTLLASSPFEWHPELSPYGLASVIVSTTDQRAIVIRSGRIIGSAPVRVNGPAEGGWAYLLRAADEHGRRWLKLQFHENSDGGMEVPQGEASRFQMPDGFRQAVLQVLRPGSIIVVSPEPLRLGNPDAPVTLIEDDPAGRD